MTKKIKSLLKRMFVYVLIFLHIFQINMLTASSFYGVNHDGSKLLIAEPLFFSDLDKYLERSSFNPYTLSPPQETAFIDTLKTLNSTNPNRERKVSILKGSHILCSEVLVNALKELGIALEIEDNAIFSVESDGQNIEFPDQFTHRGSLFLKNKGKTACDIVFGGVNNKESLSGNIVLDGFKHATFGSGSLKLNRLQLLNVERAIFNGSIEAKEIHQKNKALKSSYHFNAKIEQLDTLTIEAPLVSFHGDHVAHKLKASHSTFSIKTGKLFIDIQDFTFKTLDLQFMRSSDSEPIVFYKKGQSSIKGQHLIHVVLSNTDIHFPKSLTLSFAAMEIENAFNLTFLSPVKEGKKLSLSASHKIVLDGLATSNNSLRKTYLKASNVDLFGKIYSPLVVNANSLNLDKNVDLFGDMNRFDISENAHFRGSVKGNTNIRSKRIHIDKFKHDGSLSVFGGEAHVNDSIITGVFRTFCEKTLLSQKNTITEVRSPYGRLELAENSETHVRKLFALGTYFVQRSGAKLFNQSRNIVIAPTQSAFIYHLEAIDPILGPTHFDEVYIKSNFPNIASSVKAETLKLIGHYVSVFCSDFDAKEVFLDAKEVSTISSTKIIADILQRMSKDQSMTVNSMFEGKVILDIAREVVQDHFTIRANRSQIVADSVKRRNCNLNGTTEEILARDHTETGTTLTNSSQSIKATTIGSLGSHLSHSVVEHEAESVFSKNSVFSFSTFTQKAKQKATLEGVIAEYSYTLQNGDLTNIKDSRFNHSVVQQVAKTVNNETSRLAESVFESEADQINASGIVNDKSVIKFKAKEAVIKDLFGCIEDFQLQVNRLKISGKAKIQKGLITALEEGQLPKLDISDLFIVEQETSLKDKEDAKADPLADAENPETCKALPLSKEEKTIRPTFVVMCDGKESDLSGFMTKGDGSVVIEAKELPKDKRLKPYNIEAFNLYLDFAPKTQEDVFDLANSLSKVTHLKINAKDVLLLLESGRVYTRENLSLHLKAMNLKNVTLEGKGNLEITTEENIETFMSELKTSGRLVLFSGGHLLRTGSKTYSGEGSYIGARENVQDLAHREEKQKGLERFVTYRVCEDKSEKQLITTAGGHYQAEASVYDAPLQVFNFFGSFVFADVHNEYHYLLSSSDYKKQIDNYTSQGAKFLGKHGFIYSNGVGQEAKDGPRVSMPGIFVNPNIQLDVLKIERQEGLPCQKVEFRVGENNYHFFEYQDDSDFFSTDISVTQEQKKTFSYPIIAGSVIFEGPLKVMAQKVKEVSGSVKSQGFYTTLVNETCRQILDPLGKQKIDYIAHLKIDPNKLEHEFAQETYHYDHQHITGPGIGLLVVVAVIITVCTMGKGAPIAAEMLATTAAASSTAGAAAAASTSAAWFAAGTTSAAVANAAFTTLCIQNTTNLLINKGDPFKSFVQLFEKESIKSLVMSMLSAGIQNEVLAIAGLQKVSYAVNQANTSKEITEQTINAVNKVVDSSKFINDLIFNIKEGFVQAGVGGCVNATFGVKNPFANVLRDTLSHAVGKTGASFVKDLKLEGMDERLAHGLSGGLTGAIIDKEQGALSGATAAMFSNDVAHFLVSQGVSIETAAKAAQVSGASIAAVFGHNINVGSTTAANTMTYAFKPKMYEIQLQQELAKLEEKRLERERVEAEKRAEALRKAEARKEAEAKKRAEAERVKKEYNQKRPSNILEEKAVYEEAFEHLLGGNPLTPRSKARSSAERLYDALGKTQEGKHYLDQSGLTKETLANNAYDRTEDIIVFEAQGKSIFEQPLSGYEQKVLDEVNRGWNQGREFAKDTILDSTPDVVKDACKWASDKARISDRFQKSERYWKEYQKGEKKFSLKHAARHYIAESGLFAGKVSEAVSMAVRSGLRSVGVDKESAHTLSKLIDVGTGVKSIFTSGAKTATKDVSKTAAKVAKAEMKEAVNVVKAPANSNFPAPKTAANGPKQVKQPLRATGTDGVPANPNFTQGHASSNVTGSAAASGSGAGKGVGPNNAPTAKKGPVRADPLPPAAQSRVLEAPNAVERGGLQNGKDIDSLVKRDYLYEPAPYHTTQLRKGKSMGPTFEEGQYYLERSIPVKSTNPKKVAVKEDGTIIVFPGTETNLMNKKQIVYHGHFTSWKELNSKNADDIKNALVKAGLYTPKGRFIKGSE